MPAQVQLNAGQTAQLAVEVVDVQNLYGFDLQVGFDPDVVEVVDADPARDGVQVTPGDFLDAGFVAVNEVDNTTGTLRFVTTQLNPSQPRSGSGVLIRLQLRALGNGSTPVTLMVAELADRDGEVLTSAYVHGRVEVGAQGTQGTVTSAPTQGAPTATRLPGYPEPTQPGYPAPESPTPPVVTITQGSGYPLAESPTPPRTTLPAPTEPEEPLPAETSTPTPLLSPTQPSAPPEDSSDNALLETAIILIVILVLALGAIFIFLQLTRG
jgi:hypothetical protein